MSNFLDELEVEIKFCRDLHNDRQVEDVVEMINDLGENARKMLDIGIVMDELVKLGFSYSQMDRFLLKLKFYQEILVRFDLDSVWVMQGMKQYHYSSPTWQQDLINKVKELINDK